MTNSFNTGPGVGQKLIIVNEFKCAVKQCDNMKLDKAQKAELAGSSEPCATLGTMKHECVKNKMEGRPGTLSERSFDTAASPPTLLPGRSFWGAWRSMKAICKAAGQTYVKGRMRRPDLVIGSGQPPQDVYDAKFPCSRSVKRGAFKGRNTFPSANKAGKLVGGQKEGYRKIAGGGKVKAVSPADARTTRC
mgnify:CR=1 FL=1